jgi:S1-C subfamily serine protease
VAGVVFAEDLVVVPAQALDDDMTAVRRADGHTTDGVALGRSASTGLGVVRAAGLGVPPIAAADEPAPGSLALAIGRTWSGGVFATLSSVCVVGGPLRTGRATEIARVIRIAQPPHGALAGGVLADGAGRALGVITSAAIRGTTLVIPAALAFAAASEVASHGGARQGFIGVSSTTVALPTRQRGGRPQQFGLLVTGVSEGSPADAAGFLVGDIIVGFEGQPVQEPEELLMWLRGNRIGESVPITLLRGTTAVDVPVTIGDRRRG